MYLLYYKKKFVIYETTTIDLPVPYIIIKLNFTTVSNATLLIYNHKQKNKLLCGRLKLPIISLNWFCAYHHIATNLNLLVQDDIVMGQLVSQINTTDPTPIIGPLLSAHLVNFCSRPRYLAIQWLHKAYEYLITLLYRSKQLSYMTVLLRSGTNIKLSN